MTITAFSVIQVTICTEVRPGILEIGSSTLDRKSCIAKDRNFRRAVVHSVHLLSVYKLVALLAKAAIPRFSPNLFQESGAKPLVSSNSRPPSAVLEE